MVVFSMAVRILSITFLWIYFDSKTLILLVTLMVINFLLAYKLEYNFRVERRRRSGVVFSIWMTSFINIFTPCWYKRQEAEIKTEESEVKDMKRISSINLPCNLLILTWVAICFILVNYSQFRYNNNVLNNEDFVVASLSLVTFILVNIFLNCLYLYDDSTLKSSRDILVIITCFLSFLSSIVALSLYICSDESRNLTIIAQHYQNKSGDPRLYLKSYRALLLRDRGVSSGDLGEVITCNTLMNEIGYGEEKPGKVLMFDPVNAKCGQALENQTHIEEHIAGVLVIEDWDYRSSSPYPRHHRHLSMESLLSLPPPISLLSISKLSRLEFERFITMRTFLSSLGDDHLQSLQQYTQNQLTVNCGEYSCVNLKSTESIFLNNDSYPSMHVKITSEEMSYSQGGLYRLASFRTEDYFANIRLGTLLKEVPLIILFVDVLKPWLLTSMIYFVSPWISSGTWSIWTTTNAVQIQGSLFWQVRNVWTPLESVPGHPGAPGQDARGWSPCPGWRMSGGDTSCPDQARTASLSCWRPRPVMRTGGGLEAVSVGKYLKACLDVKCSYLHNILFLYWHD